MDFDWEKIKKSLKEGAQLSMEKIEEYTKIGKLKIEEMAAKRKIERNFADIGQKVYELYKDGKANSSVEDPAITKAIKNIDELKDEIVTIEKKIKAIIEESKKARRKKEPEEQINGV